LLIKHSNYWLVGYILSLKVHCYFILNSPNSSLTVGIGNMKNREITGRDGVPSKHYDTEWIKSAWGTVGAEDFLKDPDSNIRPRVQTALDIRPIEGGMKVLDVGCGRGEVVIYAAKRGAEAYGVDYSLEVINLARQVVSRLSQDEQARVHLYHQDLKTIPFDNEMFDRVYMLDLVEHLYDWELDGLLERVQRILKHTGVIVIHTLPNRWVYDVAYQMLRRLIPVLPKDPRGKQERKIHVNEQTVLSIYELFTRHRFYCKVFLSEELSRQANWYAAERFGDKRDRLYRLLRNPLVRAALKCITYMPIKLLLLNDIYAVAAKSKSSLPEARFGGYEWEKHLIRLASRRQGKRRCRISDA
jgi:ubiquinone/menaquinone biosynthesis C-methylase UbiE